MRLEPESRPGHTSEDLPKPLVSTSWLAEHLQDDDIRILDCSVIMEVTGDHYHFVSGRRAYDSGHIPGSVFVDVMEEMADRTNPLPMMMPPASVFARTMAGHGVGNSNRVVLYDRSNHAWAARVWWMLRATGFDAAAVLDGGWAKWIAERRQVSTEVSAYAQGAFVPKPRPGLFADKQEVSAAMTTRQICLIHALSPEEFRGERTNFQRPGRIPGSENVYCQSLIDPDSNSYLHVEELRALFAGTRALTADRVIVYCGAGIAASSDALALTALGLGDKVAVYDGSLAEWTADPSLPMETG
jgi:thiosulfate/3-mercaptopyruvate sulfurtransferase